MNNYIYTFYEECCTLYRLESRGYTWLDKRRENAPLGGEGERGGREGKRGRERLAITRFTCDRYPSLISIFLSFFFILLCSEFAIYPDLHSN